MSCCFGERHCGDSLLPLGCSDDQSGEKSISLRGRDRLRDYPQWFPGFLNYCSLMFPERLRNKSELVGSEETRQVLTRHPRYETLSYWILLRVSWLPSVRVVFGHHVRVGFCLWAIELARVMRKIPHFGIGIIWGAIHMSFPVFWINVSGRSLNSYGTSPNLWVQKELVKFRQGTQDTRLRFAKFFRVFLGYPPLNLLGDLGDVILG